MAEPDNIVHGDAPDMEQLFRLASTLVQNTQQAEDVVQDAWLRGLHSRKDVGSLTNRYLRTSVRNGVRSLWRARDRRERRERDTARSADVPSALEELQSGEFRQIMTEAVSELREPYRTTIARRFFDDLSPKEIAELDNLPDATVRSRLKRGLAGLRDSLDRRYGRKSWIQGFAILIQRETGTSPLAAERAAPASPAQPATTPLRILPIATSAIIVVSAAILVGRLTNTGTWSAGSDASGVFAAATPVSLPTVHVNGSVADESAPRRASVVAPSEEGSASEAVAGAGVLLHVRDGAGRELADVRVVTSHSGDRLTPGWQGDVSDKSESRFAASPFVLPAVTRVAGESPVEHRWVGAPGFAWQRLSIDRSERNDLGAYTERFVSLDSGADLVVHLPRLSAELADASPSPGVLQLFLHDEMDRLVARVPVESARVRINALPVGALRVTAGYSVQVRAEDVGEHTVLVRGADIVAGQVVVSTIAGALVETTIVLDPKEQLPSPVVASVSLSLPPHGFDGELYGRSVELRMRAAEDSLHSLPGELTRRVLPVALSAAGLDRDVAHAVEVAPGSYTIEVYPFCYQEEVRVHANADVRIEVPELGEVHVSLLNAGVEGLFFRRVIDTPHTPLISQWPVDPVTQTCTAWLAPGRYLVQPSTPGEFAAGAARLDVQVEAGWNDFEFDERDADSVATMLEIEFLIRGVRVPLDGIPFEISAVGHEGVALSAGALSMPKAGEYVLASGWTVPDRATRDLHLHVLLTRPGEYELGAFTLPSFRALPERRVSVRHGETQRVTYELESN